MVTPLARHRPWMVARQLANLDHLSQGRIVCTIGLGMDNDFSAFGEQEDTVVRAQKLDEGLQIMHGLWTTDAFTFHGEHYQLENVTLLPKPLQTPRIPVWAAGGWPRKAPFRRAARWDGACIKSVHDAERRWLTLEETAACINFVRAQEPQQRFDMIMSGELPDDPTEARHKMEALAAVGVTWWCEEGLGWSLDEFRERVGNGPPTSDKRSG